jgi:ABC-type nickel/cobalt efflux system permease component RcnA
MLNYAYCYVGFEFSDLERKTINGVRIQAARSIVHSHHHHHGPATHSHVPEAEITWGNLITLAVSGGLVPCESALILLLSAIVRGAWDWG